jgi:hypothetical protein
MGNIMENLTGTEVNNIVVKNMETNNTNQIYILKLQQNKYYVGKTNNVNKRYIEHLEGIGSAWTNKYKPLNIIESIPISDIFDEDKYVLKYMREFGIENVRGGSFCKLVLDEKDCVVIQRMLNGSKDQCYNCGEKGHFVNNCPLKFSNIISKIDNDFVIIGQNPVIEVEDNMVMFNCKYCDKEFDTLKGVTYHQNLKCPKKYNKGEYNCFRCGRKGHFSDNCRFITHLNGKKLD